MRAVSFLMAGLAAGASFGAVACGNGDDTASPPAALAAPDAGKGRDATAPTDGSPGVDATLADAGEPDAGEPEGGTPTLALLRVANWSADSPAVDFCLAPHGTGAFRGPILGETAAAIGEAGVIDAGSGGVAFPSASAYLLTDPGQYDARLVVAGSVDCTTGLTKDATLPMLPSGGLQTLALMGAAHPQHGESGLKIAPFVDELTTNAFPGALIIRVINAEIDLPNVQVGTLGPNFTSFFPRGVMFGQSSAGDPTADPNGYIAQLPIANEGILASMTVASLGAPANTTVATAQDISLPKGNSVTFVVVGATEADEAGTDYGQILECVDNAGTVGLEGSCNVISQ